jgi:hypothetical protein
MTSYTSATPINSNSSNKSILEEIGSLARVVYNREVSLIILICSKVSYSKAITLY